MRAYAVALGVFDGVHLGHRAVLQKVTAFRNSCAFAFRAESIMTQKNQAGYVYSSELRERLLTACGIEKIIAPDFVEFQHMDGRTFAEQVLLKKLQASVVCCGKDFRFGENAVCDVQDLQKFGAELGFQVQITEDVRKDGMTVSSTAIRKMLTEGSLEQANTFLGQPYQIWQEVIHGAELGRTIQFPTINQLFAENQLVPKFGVYASETILPNGRTFRSLTNIGLKPTVHYSGQPLAETFLIDFSGDLYGQKLQVNLLHFLRPEQKFSSVQALQTQMQKDLLSCQ